MRIATRLGVLGQVLHALLPRVSQIIMNTSFRMFPDSDAARSGDDKKISQMNADQRALQQLLKGVHF